jgi:hypothetical protein
VREAGVFVCVVLMAGCGNDPPHHYEGAHGVLDSNPSCFTYDGMASITIDEDYMVTVGLPPYPNVWGRGGASLVKGDPSGCQYVLGVSGARVQFGDPVDDASCKDCMSKYRPLYVEGLSFAPVTACNTCDTTDCISFDGASADRWYMWCDTFLEETP